MTVKRIYFICLTATNFFDVLYYMHKVQWDEHTEKIFVWAKAGKTKPEFKPYEALFDRTFYLDYADGRSLVKSQFDKVLKAGYLFPFSELGRYMKESLHNNLLVCFNDLEYCTTKCMDFFSRYEDNRIVMMDDGSALYFEKIINPPTKAAYFVNRILGARLNNSAGTDPKIDVLMACSPDKLPPFKKRGHRVIRQNDVFRDKEFLSSIQKELACRLPQKQDKWVLWLGQPVEEVRMGEHQEEALADIFQAFIKENYHILVKPHPREHKEKYLQIAKKAAAEQQMTILDPGELYWIPIEAYVELLAPEAIACFFSTAAGRIRDLGYICDTWYCFDFLKKDIEDDYLKREIERPCTFRVHDKKELEEKLREQSIKPEAGEISEKTEQPEINQDLDIAYFESLGKEKDVNERAE